MGPYRDLCVEIDIIQVRIRNLESEYKYWLQASFQSSINKAFPLDICLNRMEKICNQVEEYTCLLEEKEKTRKEIEKRMSEFEGIEQKVTYFRDVQGMTLPEIAAHLNFSYSWIKKLSMKTTTKKKKKGTLKELTG